MKWLGFIVLLIALLIPMPVMAIGVSPYIANINVQANSYTELVFNVTGCSEVDLFLEGIPLTVEPSHTLVIDNKVTAKILGSLSVPSRVYEGYLVLLESGKEVGAGVKVSLTVNHINNSQSVLLTTTVLSNSSGVHWSNEGSSFYYNPYLSLLKPPIPPIKPDESDITFTPFEPTVTPPAITEPEDNEPWLPEETTPTSSINWWFVGMLVTGVLGIIILIILLRSRHAHIE